MEKNKKNNSNLNDQVHSEFETSEGNSFDIVRKETPVKKEKNASMDEPLNQLPEEEGSVKKEEAGENEPPKMSAPEKE